MELKKKNVLIPFFEKRIQVQFTLQRKLWPGQAFQGRGTVAELFILFFMFQHV